MTWRRTTQLQSIKPADVLKPRKRRNYARIDAADLPPLLHAMDTYVGSEHTRLALQLMALTFVRTSELIGARWSEIDTAPPGGTFRRSA